jgi:hypothetical protein
MKPKIVIIFFSCFLLVILISEISHKYYLREDFKLNVKFIVEKKEEQINGRCHLFDKKNKELPLKNFLVFKNQVYVGDSIVKESNSYMVCVYRKRNCLDYTSDNSYFVAEKINLEK